MTNKQQDTQAWEFFKAHEMGKTSASGRAVDYSSKIAVRCAAVAPLPYFIILMFISMLILLFIYL